MLRTIDQDQDLEQCVIDGFNTAGPLLMITTHLLVAQTLMHNPEDYVEKAERVPAIQAVKTPLPDGLENSYWIQ